jgi:hypothetical protein
MAASADEAERLMDEAMAFMDANGMIDVEAAYNVKYLDNLAKQGGTIFTR